MVSDRKPSQPAAAIAVLLLWIVVPVLAWDSQGDGRPLTTVFTARDTKPNLKAWSAVQDSDGVMYFGGDSIFIFDGQRWDDIPFNDTHSIYGLDIDASGRLWYGSSTDLGFCQRGERGWERISLSTQLPFNKSDLEPVRRVFCMANAVYFFTERRILAWDGTRFMLWEFASELRSIFQRTDKDLKISAAPGRYYRMTDRGPVPIDLPADFPTAAIVWNGRIGGRDFWLTRNGPFIEHDGALRALPPPPSIKVDWSKLFSSTQLRSGALVMFFTDGRMLVLSKEAEWRRAYDAAQGMPSYNLISVTQDRDGGLWLGAKDRIIRVAPPGTPVLHDINTGLRATRIAAVARNRDRWIAATDAGLFQLPTASASGSKWSGLHADSRFFVALQSSTRGVLAGRMWGIDLLRGNSLRTVYKAQVPVYAVLEREDRSIIATEDREIRLLRWEVDQLVARESVWTAPDIPNLLVNLSDGDLLAGTRNSGLYRLHRKPDGTWQRKIIGPSEGLPTSLTLINLIAVERAIFAVGNKSIYRFIQDKGHFVSAPFTRADTHQIVDAAAGSGRLWIITQVAHPSESAHYSVLAYPIRTEGIGAEEVYEPEGLGQIATLTGISIHGDTEGNTTLWITGYEGALRIAANTLSPAKPPKPPILIDANPRSLLRGGSMSLPYSQNRLRFSVAAPGIRHHEQTRFQYRLVGLETDWSTPTTDAVREYLQVNEGDYRFEARVLSGAHLKSEPFVAQVSIRPPWHRTLWSYLAYLAIAAGIGFGINYWRVGRLKKRTEELALEVDRATEDLRRANDAKSEFVARMSHDIRNPINGIVGISSALANTTLDPRQREWVGEIAHCGRFVSHLVDEILDFAQIEAGSIALHYAPFSPKALLEATISLLKVEIQRRGARVRVDLDPSLPAFLEGDATRIQQILLNYLSNALKYAPQDEIVIGARDVRGMDSNTDLLDVEYFVSDRGPGLPEQEREKVFDRFYRSRESLESGVRGIGLGLAICRLLAAKMGGRVGARDHSDRGSVFFVLLPLRRSAEPNTTPGASTPPGSRGCALVIEDEGYNAIALRAMLEQAGFSVTVATSGAEALNALTDENLDVAFVDWELKDTTGPALARAYRAAERNGRHLPLIATTAYSSAEAREECLAAGMDAFATKPLTPEKLHRILSSLPQVAPDTPPTPTSPPLGASRQLDVTLLDYLVKAGGGNRVDDFAAKLAADLAALSQAIASWDIYSSRKRIHDIIGAGQIVGDRNLVDAGEALHASVSAGDRTKAAEALGQLHKEAEKTLASISAYRSLHP